jgi:hypothetical protein
MPNGDGQVLNPHPGGTPKIGTRRVGPLMGSPEVHDGFPCDSGRLKVASVCEVAIRHQGGTPELLAVTPLPETSCRLQLRHLTVTLCRTA